MSGLGSMRLISRASIGTYGSHLSAIGSRTTWFLFAEEHLLLNDANVLALFRANPFGAAPPHYVRAVLWQYWFTSMDEKRSTGNWWRRSLLGQYAPTLARTGDGHFAIVHVADELPPHD